MRPVRDNKSFSAVFLAVAAVFSLAHLNATADEAVKRARKGAEEYKKQNYDGALDNFHKAAELNNGSAAIQYDLGTTLLRKGKYQEAGEALARSLNLGQNPSDSNSYFNLGYSRVKEALAPPEKADLPGAGQPILNAPAGMTLPKSAQPPPPSQTPPIDPNEKLKKLKSGLEAFRQAVIANPKDRDAKYNYETTKMMVRQLEEEMKKQQQQSDDKDKNKDQKGDDKNKDDKSQGKGDQKQDPKNKDEQNRDSDQKQSDQEKSDEQKEKESKQNQEGQPTTTPTPGGDSSQDSQSQKSGLEGTPTPQPQEQKGDQKQQNGLEAKASPTPQDGDQKGAAGAAGAQATPPPMTPEQLDALRVLNALAQENPEQFKKLFRFQGRGTGKRPSKDW